MKQIEVIVPAYCAEEMLGSCLEALVAAGFDHSDILVVDDASLDRTADVAVAAGVSVLEMPRNIGAAEARNAGVAATKADLIVFVDADVVVHSDVRRRIEAFFTAYPDHAAVFGSYDDAPPQVRAVGRLRNLLHHHVHQQAGGAASTFWTGLGAVRRADFEAVGGFRATDAIEDVAFGVRLAQAGRPIRLEPQLRGAHLKAWTWRSFFWTDYHWRAQPWVRMMRAPEHRAFLSVLNVKARGKAAVVSVGASLLAVVILPVFPAIGLVAFSAALLALVVVERGFLRLVFERYGARDTIVGVGMLWVHHLAAGLGFVRVLLFG